MKFPIKEFRKKYMKEPTQVNSKLRNVSELLLATPMFYEWNKGSII